MDNIKENNHKIYYGKMMKHGSGNKTLLVGRLEFKLTIFWVHKDMSNSYREGTARKLKSMAQPYKIKGLKKVDKVLCLRYKDW